MKQAKKMLPIAWRLARQRVGAMLMIAFAVAGGAVLITAAGLLMQTGIAATAPVGSLSKADIVVTGQRSFEQPEDFDIPLAQSAGVDPDVQQQLATNPDVHEATGRITVQVTPVLPAGSLVTTETAAHTGANWNFGVLGSPDIQGAQPQTRDQVALSQELASKLGVEVGDQHQFIVAGEQDQFEITAVIDVAGETVFFADQNAHALAGEPEMFEYIGVTAADGTSVDQLAGSLEDEFRDSELEFVTGEERGDVAYPETAPARSMLIILAGALGGTLVLTVGFIVSASIAVSVNQQRREVALLRATGATPRQVRGLVSTQAMIATVLALPLGILGGYLVTEPLAQSLKLADLMPPTLLLSWGPIPGLVCAVLMLLVVKFASSLAAMRISRLASTEAIAESTIESKKISRIRITIGWIFIALSLITACIPLLTRTEVAFISSSTVVLLGCIGLAMAGPAMVRTFTGMLASRSERSGVISWLAAHNNHAYATRTAGGVAVLALAVALAVMQLFVTTTQGEVAQAELEDGQQMKQTISAGQLAGIVEDNRRDLAGAEDVTDAVGTISVSILRPYESDGREHAEELQATAFSQDPTAVADVGIVEGDISLLGEDTFAMEAERAWILGISIGDRLELITDSGLRASPKLIATYERWYAYGSIITSTDLLNLTTGERPYDAVLANGESAAIQQWADRHPGMEAHSAAATAQAGGVAGDRWLNLVLTLVLLGYVVMAGGNTIVRATNRRKTEMSLLRLIGATPRQVRAMMRKEATLMCLMATVAGLALSLPAVVFLGLGLLGRPWPQGPLWAIPVIVAVVCAVAYLTVMSSTHSVLRTPPTQALTHE